MAPLGRLTAAIPALLLLAPAAAAAQEEAADPDSVPVAPDTAGPAVSDTAAEDTLPPVYFPRALEEPRAATASEVHVWTREDFLAASALSLEAFLTDRAPGLLPLRSNFHFGPHHLVDGLWGPAGITVVVDGRELPPLAASQVDLSAVSLAGLERLRLVRRAGETILEMTTVSHGGGEAYSRIAAATGQPGADMFRGLFTNGAGRRFAVAAALDYLNVGAGEQTGNRLDAAARLSWMPWDTTSGIELRWRSESMERRVLGSLQTFDRRDLLLHLRGRPGPDLELEAWVGRSKRSPLPSFLVPADDPEAGEEGSVTTEHARARVTATPASGSIRAEVGVQGGAGRPDLTGRLRAGVPLGDLTVEAGARAAAWDGFTTASASAGLAWRPAWLEGLTLRGEAETGTRAPARPGRPVGDSLRFDADALAGGLELEVGPVRLAERVTRQVVGSRPTFGGTFDAPLAAGPRAEVTGWESRVALPPLPFSLFRDRLTLRGFWRRSVPSGASPLYVPEDLVRGWLVLHDQFYEGNLEIRASGGLAHRDGMLSASPGTGETVALPAERVFLAELVLRIDTFRFWIRNDNTRSVQQRDFAGLDFTPTRLVFGVRWEFTD